MMLPLRPTGIISYAGLDEETLLETCKDLFAQEDVPDRFQTLFPLFPAELVVDMPYAGEHPRASRLGFSQAEDEYHRVLSEDFPSLYAGENRRRCFASDGTFRGGVVTVDEIWADAFVQYRPFLGERLTLHLIGGGHQAVAVPESLYPRMGLLMEKLERSLGITARCQDYCVWLRDRLLAGEAYDPEQLEQTYLQVHGLRPFGLSQEALARTMQEMSILYSLQSGAPAPLYTDACRQAETIAQYTPFRCACDVFEPTTLNRQTSRLMQLSFEGDSFASDFWLPWQDAQLYLDKRKSTLDVRALCEGFQLAPAPDADARGGVYPSCVRVVSVMDRTLRPLVAQTVNNPAYGAGLNPMGFISRIVYLPGSAALLSSGRLTLESHAISCENTRVPEDDYLRMRALAEWQEHKGRLVDALYRRESALSRMQPGSLAYRRAHDLLQTRVERVTALVKSTQTDGQLSDYDADIAYLRRLGDWREGLLSEPPARDVHREISIESGFAMRSLTRRFAMADLCSKPVRERPARAESRIQRAANGQTFEQMDFLDGLSQPTSPAPASTQCTTHSPSSDH